MTSNFNTFVPKSDQLLAQNPRFHSGLHPETTAKTTEWMFRFVCWLRNLDSVEAPDSFQTAVKTGVQGLAILGMVVLSPLIVGGVLFYWYNNADNAIDLALACVGRIENEDAERIVKALGVEKQRLEVPIVENRPKAEELEATFKRLDSPIFQCNGDFIALWIRDKESKQTRIATIEKTDDGWNFNEIKSFREFHWIDLVREEQNFYCFKKLLKGRSVYDELALPLKRTALEELVPGGPCISEDEEIIQVLGNQKIPTLQKKPLSRDRMAAFQQLNSPIFQSGGNFISLLMQNKNTLEKQIATIKKVDGSWIFKNFPVSVCSSFEAMARGERVDVEWSLCNGKTVQRTVLGQQKDKDEAIHLEFLETLVKPSDNLYRLAPSWPENPTSANDLSNFTSDQVATAPIALIKKLLKEKFFKDNQLFWTLLPYLSEQHLCELSLSDFTSEFQLAVALMGKDNNTLRRGLKKVDGPYHDLPDHSGVLLAEARKRFSLLMKGAEVRKAIEENRLRPLWLSYLTAQELAAAYSFKELNEKGLLESAFSSELSHYAGPTYLPEERLRFDSFTAEEIQSFLEGLQDLTFKWYPFQTLLSKEKLQALDFSKLCLKRIALVIGSEWKLMSDALSQEQKEIALTRSWESSAYQAVSFIGEEWLKEKRKNPSLFAQYPQGSL